MSAFVWSPWRRNLPVCKAVTPAQLTGGGGRGRGRGEGGLLTSFFPFIRRRSGGAPTWFIGSLEFIFLVHNLECSLASRSFIVNTVAELEAVETLQRFGVDRDESPLRRQ